MNTYITLTELVLVLGLMIFSVTCAYFIFFLKRISDTVRILKNILLQNSDNIDRTFKNMPVISENLVEVTESAKMELKAVESAVNNLEEAMDMTASAAQTFKNDIIGKAKSIFELIELIKRLIFRESSEYNNSEKQKNI